MVLAVEYKIPISSAAYRGGVREGENTSRILWCESNTFWISSSLSLSEVERYGLRLCLSKGDEVGVRLKEVVVG